MQYRTEGLTGQVVLGTLDPMTPSTLLSLGTETWGERLARARSRSGVSLKEAAARVSDLAPVSYSSIMRLESMTEPPADRKRRMVAYLTLIAYGFDPEQFGLSENDIPKWITKEVLADLPISGKGWFRPYADLPRAS